MLVQHSKKAPKHKGCELRLGASSWNPNHRSVKFAWFDKRGHACRGGEVPADALVDMLLFAHEKGELDGTDLIRTASEPATGASLREHQT
jgi:hypothetical protein